MLQTNPEILPQYHKAAEEATDYLNSRDMVQNVKVREDSISFTMEHDACNSGVYTVCGTCAQSCITIFVTAVCSSNVTK